MSIFVKIATVLLIVAGVIAIGVSYIKQRQREAQKKDAEKQRLADIQRREAEAARMREKAEREKEETRERERREKENAIDQYIDVLEKQSALKKMSSYTKCFCRYGAVYQVLFGVNRRKEREEIADGLILSELEVAIKNNSVASALNENGFVINFPPEESLDREGIRNHCRQIATDNIRREIRRIEGNCSADEANLKFRAWIEETGADLFAVVEAVEKKDVSLCLEKASVIQKKLALLGCYALFSDDSAVLGNEGMMIDFMDDFPATTELPGLYIKKENGEYVKINQFYGTRRRAE